jgi:hypothetical protein
MIGGVVSVWGWCGGLNYPAGRRAEIVKNLSLTTHESPSSSLPRARTPTPRLKALPLMAGMETCTDKIDRSIIEFPIVFCALVPCELDDSNTYTDPV